MNPHLSIRAVDAFPLEAPLLAPFGIASGRLERVENVAVRVTLTDGTAGWGEIPVLPPVTAERQDTALAAVAEHGTCLIGQAAGSWRRSAGLLEERLPGLPAVRAGIEMAVLDAWTRSREIPLFHFFGGAAGQLVTDITIPICPAEEAGILAGQYCGAGFETLKVKVGLDVADDIGRVRAIRAEHPESRLVLDANEGFSVDETLRFLAELRALKIEPGLLEQPIPRDDFDGLGRLAREAGVPVAADESCRGEADLLRIVRGGLAQVVNIKLSKFGVVRAMDLAVTARAAGLGLMIGGMVETRIGMGFGAHFAAGLGGFTWIDLDTPLLLATDPVTGGCSIDSAQYRLDHRVSGHGAGLADLSSRD